MTRVHFVCPDLDHPSGGVRIIYRHAELLNEMRLAEARVVHHSPAFKATWFEHKAPVTHFPLDLQADDVLVVPEILAPAMLRAPTGRRTVIYNQTPYFMFVDHSFDPRDQRTPYLSPDIVAQVVVSEDARQYAQHAFPHVPVYRVRNSIDPRFRPPEPGVPKKKQLCFMPRKHPEDARQVVNLLKFRGALTGWDLVAIHHLPEEQVIAVMRDSAVFLSFGYPEGFGLPPAEAMACGCVVVGYHGNGGREYFTAEHGFPIDAGDILGFAKAAEDVLTRLSVDSKAFEQLTNRASKFIRSTYTPESERQDVKAAWNRILEGAAVEG